jgi:polysaccharide export outer membrane protein
VRLDATGTIMFPLIGDVRVSGKSVHAVRDEIQRRLAPFVVNPQVLVNVTGVQSQKVLLLGEVKNPGVYALDNDLTISEAVGRSGGLTDDAKDGAVILVRRSSGRQVVTAVDVGKILKRGAVADDVALGNGDIVYVPKKAIASVSWLMSHITNILSPIVMAETGIVLWPQMIDALEGTSSETPISIPTR